MVDLESLIHGIPAKNRWLPSPDETFQRRRHTLEEELANSVRVQSPIDARLDLDWLSESVVFASALRFPTKDELVDDDAIASEGVEALAWYEPFHANPDRWGIYLLDRGV